MKSPNEWSEAENFVWEKTRAGEIADFNEQEHEKLNLESSAGWSNSRRISSAFLETILSEKSFREEVTPKGVRIVGAYFPDNLDLEDEHLPWPLRLKHSRFENELNMRELQADRAVSFEGSFLAGKLDMNAASTGRSLLMGEGTFEEIDLGGAQIGGQLSLRKATVTGKLNMNTASIGRSLLMGEGAFEEIDLGGAQIGGELSLRKATVTGKLNMNVASTGRSLLMGDGATFEKEVILRGAQIGGQLSLIKTTVTGKLNMNAVSISRSLLMRRGCFAETNLDFAVIGSNLDLSDGTFGTLNLKGTTVGRDLRLGQGNKPEGWAKSDKIQLDLRDTQVGTLIDSPSSWPDKVQLRGFTYRRLGGFNMSERSVNDFIDWLERDKTFSFQPYLQLAAVLREAGRAKTADAVLFAGKKRERQEASGWKRLRLSLLEYGIGYGSGLYAIRRVLCGGVILSMIGWFILYVTGEYQKHVGPLEECIGFWFSLDYLLPIIRLQDAYYEKVNLSTGFVRYYFHAHQVIGHAMASYLIAVLSGITKPEK